MTEAFAIGHFSTSFNLHGVDPKSAPQQGMYLFTTLTVEGIDPAARAVEHTLQ